MPASADPPWNVQIRQGQLRAAAECLRKKHPEQWEWIARILERSPNLLTDVGIRCYCRRPPILPLPTVGALGITCGCGVRYSADVDVEHLRMRVEDLERERNEMAQRLADALKRRA